MRLFNLTKDTNSKRSSSLYVKNIIQRFHLRETNDEVPNLGFSLSNKKLLKTGFSFLI